ncbi:TetR/AcrR family transcriptional regulator [Streptomyces sp. NPDC013978]|uniref:TetR/AcrR family transcriptional regulator n=1 Tax=Streptomyces sp. NPDC013978 TaxID=3364869 RepID=UPI0036FF111E
MRTDARRNYERILRTAVEHFAAYGVDTSLEDIARGAGVGPGTLYRHFPTREDLLAAALQDRQTQLLARKNELEEGVDPADALREWLRELRHHLRTFKGLADPMLGAVKGKAAPLTLTCQSMESITGDFLRRAQAADRARTDVSARDLFLSALALAWIEDCAEDGAASIGSLEDVIAFGYRVPA